MIDFLKKSIGIIVLLVLAFIAFLSFYRFYFQGGITNEHSIWSEFGTIFSGILGPLFAAINICIFWYLTKVVDENNDKRQNQAANHEKAIMQMQFRKAEIDRFEDTISNALVPMKDNDLYKLIRPIMLAITYIESFLSTKLDIFNLDEKSETAQNLIALHKDLADYFKKLSAEREIPKDLLKNEPLTLESIISLQNKLKEYYKTNDENSISSDLMNDMIKRKNLIVLSLQQITLN